MSLIKFISNILETDIVILQKPFVLVFHQDNRDIAWGSATCHVTAVRDVIGQRQSWQSVMFPWQPVWSEALKSVATQLLRCWPRVGHFSPQLLFVPLSQAAWTWSGWKSLVTFCCHGYALLYDRQRTVLRTTEACFAQTCVVVGSVWGPKPPQALRSLLLRLLLKNNSANWKDFYSCWNMSCFPTASFKF